MQGIDVRRNNNWLIVRLNRSGFTEMELERCRQHLETELQEGPRNLILSFDPATRPYSRILALVAQCKRIVTRCNGELIVVPPNEEFMEVVGRAGLDRVITFAASEEQAMLATMRLTEQVLETAVAG